MQIWGLTEEQIHDAMTKANEEYGDLIFNRKPEKYGRGYRLTLRMISSNSHGATMTDPRNIYGEVVGTPRKSVSASWDAHGCFMAKVFSINPMARIKSASYDIRGVNAFLTHYPEGAYYVDNAMV